MPPLVTLSRRTLLTGAAATLAVPTGFGALANDETPLRYHSDYISFVGRDAKGAVYFALDTNRGRAGDTFQAEHFVVGYADGEGFLNLKKTGLYENKPKELIGIPSSEFFQFEGTARRGLMVRSPVNQLELAIKPIPRTLDIATVNDGFYWVGATPATMKLNGRRIEGRVIFEALAFDRWNRFVRNYSRPWKNFNGLYLMTDDGHDFYVHSVDWSGTLKKPGWLAGLATWGGPAPISNIDFQITRYDAAKTREGRYARFNWPFAWKTGFDYAGARYELVLTTRERGLNWIWSTNGFEMSIVDGEIRDTKSGTVRKVTGWGELLL